MAQQKNGSVSTQNYGINAKELALFAAVTIWIMVTKLRMGIMNRDLAQCGAKIVGMRSFYAE